APELNLMTGATESGIVGGRVAMPHSRPYMASLHYQGQHPCGGILIRKDFVLTAAHCKYQDNMVVVLGAHNISDKEKMQQRIEVAKYYKYPDYTGGFDYDIMLLKLKTKATLNKYVKTIDLPKKDRSFPANVKCAVAGWGKTGSTVTNSKVLRETTEKTQSSPECKKVRGEYFSEDDLHQLQTNLPIAGGPLICNSKVEGITDFPAEDECDNPDYPHGFVKVGFYLPWIKTTSEK
uniref:trypsin n=1 Tax=Nothobranchius furzeri TaxID=105023 RepID=A0A8C6PXK6_NOTFU